MEVVVAKGRKNSRGLKRRFGEGNGAGKGGVEFRGRRRSGKGREGSRARGKVRRLTGRRGEDSPPRQAGRQAGGRVAQRPLAPASREVGPAAKVEARVGAH